MALQCVNITIEDDGVTEGVEMLGANLFNNPSFIDLEPNSTAISIIDNDGKPDHPDCVKKSY
jgi:hypothetical protein